MSAISRCCGAVCRVGHAPHHLEHDRPRVGGGRDVEEHQLVGALAEVALRELGRVALVHEVDEVRALHDPAPIDVEAVVDTSYLEEAAGMGCGQ